MNIKFGVVENRDDPLKLGRCQVRVMGFHTSDKIVLPTTDLPWAHLMQPTISAGISGVGYSPVGLVPGTWVCVTFADDDCQQPIILGSIGGIPQTGGGIQSDGKQNVIAFNGMLVDAQGDPVRNADGTPITVGSKEADATGSSTTSASTATSAQASQRTLSEPSADVLSKAIPTEPPIKTSNTAKSKQSIVELISACDKVGLTSKYAKCAILAICGGESEWLPVEEGHYYSSTDSLMKIFASVFQGNTTLAQKYTKWTGSKADFFRLIYSPDYKNGRGAGNKYPDDGALFYGRGFNQITGRSLYQQLENELKNIGVSAPLTTNPGILISDLKISALATVMFYKLNVNFDQNNSGYFAAALKRTGHNAGDGYAKKAKYYEYFFGASAVYSSTTRPNADSPKTYTETELAAMTPAERLAATEDRSANGLVGFTDPTQKYPLRNLMNEPDTNRLARGVQRETSIEFKDSTRAKGIRSANGDGDWEQPLAPFGGMYPYNKVFESESGHVMMFDDTPDNETVSIFHRTGTFTDIDANGTRVNKIVGDDYTIIDRNGAIFIAGKANVTVGGHCNVYVQGNADVEVEGEANVNVHQDCNVGVAGNMNMAIGGDWSVKVGGDINFATAGAYSIDVAQSLSLHVAMDFNTKTGGNTSLKCGGDYATDATKVWLNSGKSVDVTQLTINLTAPNTSSTQASNMPYLTTPVRPSPSVDVSVADIMKNTIANQDYIANPDKYALTEDTGDMVKQNQPPAPQDSGTGLSLIVPVDGDIPKFLKKILDENAADGSWRETGMGGAPSNPKILRIWKDIGLGSVGVNDQVAWCMAFVNWTLKQNGYRYVQTARAFDARDRMSAYKFTQVSINDCQPGDVICWKWSHVNFVYAVNGDSLTVCGGNQSAKTLSNNPSGGEVNARAWNKNTALKNIVGIYRPSKV